MVSRLPISIATWLIVLALLPAGAQAGYGAQGNLTSITGQGSGLIEVASTAHDVIGPDTFNVEGTIDVHGASPNVTLTVLRRVDLNPDGICTGGTWLGLPPPNAPDLTTSAGGAGALHFEISRGAPFVDGVSFDVQWRLVGDGSILESDCLTVTVK